MFAYKPPVTKEQFFATGFGERKVIMCAQVLQLVHSKHQSLVGISRSASARHRPNQTLPSSLGASSQVFVGSFITITLLNANQGIAITLYCKIKGS